VTSGNCAQLGMPSSRSSQVDSQAEVAGAGEQQRINSHQEVTGTNLNWTITTITPLTITTMTGPLLDLSSTYLGPCGVAASVHPCSYDCPCEGLHNAIEKPSYHLVGGMGIVRNQRSLHWAAAKAIIFHLHRMCGQLEYSTSTASFVL